MGSFAAILGHSAAGFEEAHQQDLQRQFTEEMGRRQTAHELFNALAFDPNQAEEVRNAALQGKLELTNTPLNKAYNFQKSTSPLYDLLSKHKAAQLAAANAPGPITKAAPFSAPPPPPPELAQTQVPVGTGAQWQASPAGTAGPPAPTQNVPQITMPRRQMAFAGQDVQGPPAPPAGFLTGARGIAENEGYQAQQQAQGARRGLISANKEAIAGMNLSPEEQAAFSLGMPGLMGAYGKGELVSAADAQRMGVPLPAGASPSDWLRVQRGKLGNIIGVYPASMPPAYAPTEHVGFVQVQQMNGDIQEVPITSVTQKQAPGQGAAPTPQAKVGEGKVVGGKSPTPTIMIAPPSAPGGQPTAIAVKPGSKVPTGAVTTSGLSSVTVPTSGTRTRSEFASGLIPAIDRAIVDVNHAAPKLGALKGRWNEFIAGRLGGGLDDDPEISSLRTEMGLLQTGMMVPHVGARGGVQLITKFKSMIDSGRQSAPQLTAALKEMRKFLVTYAKEGQLKGWGNEPVGQTGGPPEQSSDFFSQFGGQAR